MKRILTQVVSILEPRERRQLYILFGVSLLVACVDLVGIASIMPFMTLATDPTAIQRNYILSHLWKIAGIDDVNIFMVLAGVLVLIFLVGSLLLKGVSTYFQLRYINNIEHRLSWRVLRNYLGESYIWFLERNSSDLNKTILSEVAAVTSTAIRPLITLFSHGILSLFIITGLVLLDPLLAFYVVLFLGGGYIAFFVFNSGALNRLGRERVLANQERFLVTAEAFGAFKDILMNDLAQYYLDKFGRASKAYAVRQAQVSLIAQLPRYLMEAVAFGGLILIVIYITLQQNTLLTAVPSLSLYALAGYKLLPALQQVYGSATQLRFSSQAISNLRKDLEQVGATSPYTEYVTIMHGDVEFRGVSFRFNPDRQYVVKNLSLKVRAGEFIGLVGATGSGKSTIVDLFAGLLFPTTGEIRIGDTTLSEETAKSWRRTIGYVNQRVFIADTSIADNIALGDEPNNIDLLKVRRAAKLAGLEELVDKLPYGYHTRVGENGTALSGGQRQRIGIARALYNLPAVLILDEATNALDSLTEQSVMQAIRTGCPGVTLILIAHRVSLTRHCDRIFLIENGTVHSSGTFDSLRDSVPFFSKLIYSDRI